MSEKITAGQPDTNPAPEKIVPIAQDPDAEAESSTIVKFTKPFHFEDQTYTEVDLGGMADLTAEDMIAASNYLIRKGNVSPTPEMNIEYACYIASRATGLPVEFFRRLPLKEAVKVKTRVTNFFYAED